MYHVFTVGGGKKYLKKIKKSLLATSPSHGLSFFFFSVSITTTMALPKKEPNVRPRSLLADHIFFPRDKKEAGALRDSQNKVRSIATGSAAPKTPVAAKPERDAFFLACTNALGHMLFTCPAVIEKYISFWFSTTHAHRENLMENVHTLFQLLVNITPVLQLRIQRTVDFLNKPLSRVCGISFLRDMRQTGGEFNYECDDVLLKHKMKQFDTDVPSKLIDARMSVVLTNIITHKERGGFLQWNETVGTPTTVLTGFESNDILRESIDSSAWFVALLLHILNYCEALLNGTEETNVTNSQNAAEVDARVVTASEIFTVCNELMHTMRTWCSSISWHSIQLDDTLRTYTTKSDALSLRDDVLYGIPFDVVAKPQNTFLWLEWFWCDSRRHHTVAAKDGEEKDMPLHGLRRGIADLWRAKSVILTAEYQAFFDDWDKTWLFPLIKEATVMASEEGMQ
jgi:hypothetical protein